MAYTDEQLRAIYDSTGGYCHLCDKKLAFSNYGQYAEKAPWEVDHSNPLSRGGTNSSRNLKPACIDCNRAKGGRSNRQYLSRLG